MSLAPLRTHQLAAREDAAIDGLAVLADPLDGPVQIPLDQLVVQPRSAPLRALNRAMDIAVASIALVILSPVLAVIAVAIVLNDGRPVLFRQSRAGIHGKPFVVYKFRTMERDADGQRADLRRHNELNGAAFKMTNDPRVTKTGRILRRTSLDELPQFINVLRGQMSVVGPRPHPFDDVAGYEPWHWRRLAVKPGITGLWQVSARRERDFDRWVQLDIEYIDTWSPWRDIVIMAKTVPALLRREGR